MTARPDWALERAAEILLLATCPALRPTEQLHHIADLLLRTRAEGELAKAIQVNVIDAVAA